jgi:hypothetical protein
MKPTNKEKVKDSLLNKLDHKDWYLITLFGFPYSDPKEYIEEDGNKV